MLTLADDITSGFSWADLYKQGPSVVLLFAILIWFAPRLLKTIGDMKTALESQALADREARASQAEAYRKSTEAMFAQFVTETGRQRTEHAAELRAVNDAARADSRQQQTELIKIARESSDAVNRNSSAINALTERFSAIDNRLAAVGVSPGSGGTAVAVAKS